MGTIVEYKCKKCGHEETFMSGVSGRSLIYRIPFYCEKIKGIVMILGNASIDGGPPETPECYICKDHKLTERWDYKFCPKCLEINDCGCGGCWD